MGRNQLDRSAVIRDRLVVITFSDVHITARVKGGSIIQIEPNCFIAISKCLVVAALGVVRTTPSSVGEMGRSKLNRSAVIRNRLVVISFGGIRISALVKGNSISWIKPNCSIAI